MNGQGCTRIELDLHHSVSGSYANDTHKGAAWSAVGGKEWQEMTRGSGTVVCSRMGSRTVEQWQQAMA